MRRLSKTSVVNLAIAAVYAVSMQCVSEARSQWEIQKQQPPQAPGSMMSSQQAAAQIAGLTGATIPGQPTTLPGQAPMLPGQPTNMAGGAPMVPGIAPMVPGQIGNNFWKGQMPTMTNRVQPGVVLTGILEHTISSGKSLPGDTFAIKLEDGFVQNGMQVIPQHSKIVGSVTAVTPAKKLRAGMPGQMQVSIQSLVLPDGTHLPFSGFIDSNPAHAFKKGPKKRNLGFDIADTGKHFNSMFGAFTDGIGVTHARRHRGNEFILEEGEAIPVRLNRGLTVPESVVQPVQIATPGFQGYAPPTGAMPPMPPRTANGAAPSAVPGLIGDDVFAQPVGPTPKSLNDMPEPF